MQLVLATVRDLLRSWCAVPKIGDGKLTLRVPDRPDRAALKCYN
jgi:hypothetical protein